MIQRDSHSDGTVLYDSEKFDTPITSSNVTYDSEPRSAAHSEHGAVSHCHILSHPSTEASSEIGVCEQSESHEKNISKKSFSSKKRDPEIHKSANITGNDPQPNSKRQEQHKFENM